MTERAPDSSELPDDTRALLRELASRRDEFVGFATRRLGSEQEARDAVQAAYVRAIERLPSLRDRDRATAWFYRLLRNVLADTQTARGQARARLASDDVLDELPGDEPRDEGACCCGVALIPQLPAAHAEVIARLDLEGQPVREVAAALGITANALGVRLHRARRALREALAAYCGTSAVRACGECGCAPPGSATA